MSITPSLPAETARVRFKTWVKSQWKLSAFPGQISVEINTLLFTILNPKILDINIDNAYKVISIDDKCDLLNSIFSLTNGYCTMNIIPKTTIKHYLVGSLRYVSLGALLSSTAFISGVNAQAFTPIYQNFAYFLDNFCVQGGPACSHGVLQPSVTATQPSVGVIIGSDISADVRSIATQNGHIVGYSCLLYTSPSPRDRTRSRMPSSA